MFLEKLVDYSRRIDLPPRLYDERPVRYVIQLRADGRPAAPEPLDTADKENKRGIPRRVPSFARGNVDVPLLFADHAEYTLGVGREGADPDKVRSRHALYRSAVAECAKVTGDPRVEAVATFLEAGPLQQLRLPDDFDPSALITFTVDGQFVVDLPAVQQYWADRNEAKDALEMQCLVCGRRRPALRILEGKVKGIPGGQTSGTSIISANAEAFLSYGLEQSYIAPTCPECGERFTKAINSLLADRSSSRRIGGGVFVFWTRDDVGFDLLQYIDNPEPVLVRELIDGLMQGRDLTKAVDETAFYAASLSASGGRAVVRDWIDSTVGQVKDRVAEWLRRQAIVQRNGEEPRGQQLWRLVGATVRDLNDAPAATLQALLRSALLGTPVPERLLYLALQRTRADLEVSEAQASLIKLVLCGANERWEETLTRLDPTLDDPGYLCGRLFATIEQIQTAAAGGQEVKSTVVDRFYGTASSAPATVFGTLLRNARVRLSQLEDSNPGAYWRLFNQLQDIAERLTTLPRTLTLEQQGLFALGYYHQHAENRAAARAAAERRAQAQN
ncbi:MAG: type I-C CRISPR-associated protein Cas8c/Csd1 [Chloroflexota bacterium]|nr:type I-C CRISPR-associated protein Cas8c/Csd1 [Dehalococcoidia bacterium]MDW8255284.1 type I-C CRISPR-associated protein Cas8c/Csd1 [Chloroflexota bacterium]